MSASLVSLTAIETTGSTQTNVPITIGIPFAAGTINSAQHIAAVDGISGKSLACGEDNRYSDLTPNIRGTTLTCIIPSLNSMRTDTIALSVADGAPSTGTDITPADITATSYDAAVSIVDASGNAFTASPRTAMTSGRSGWVDLATPTVFGKWRGGNGLVTGYISYVPLTHGTTPHAWLYAKFDTECYKAERNTVGTENPILFCQTDVIVGSGVAQNRSITDGDQFYSLSIGANGSCASFPTTTGSGTLDQNLANLNATLTLTGGRGSINDLGKVWSDGTGYGVVNKFIDATHEGIAIFKPLASASLTNAKAYGIGHVYGTRYRIRCGWVPSGKPPNVSVQNGNLYLGNPWNNGTLTGGPGTHFKNSRLILNYATTPNQVTNTPQSTTQGNNPTSYLTLGGVPGRTGGDTTGGLSGDWFQHQQATGDRGEIGPNPSFFIGALIRWDSNAAPVIFQDADKANQWPFMMISGLTGKGLTASDGTDWSSDPRFGTRILKGQPGADGSMNNWSAYPQSAHQGEWFFIPYILTGDWYWLDSHQNLMFGLWSGLPPAFAGSQLNRVMLGGYTGSEPRGQAWHHRTLGRLALMLPDSATNAAPSPVLGWTKDDAKTHLENQYTAVNSGSYLKAPYPGTIIDLGTGPCPSGAICNTNFRTPGPRYTKDPGGHCLFPGFQHSYMEYAEASLFEAGMLSANGVAFWNWLAEHSVTMINDTAEVQPLYAAWAYWWEGNTAGEQLCNGAEIYDWATAYRATATLDGPPSSRWFGFGPRSPAGTAKLSATSGSAITVTIPTGYLQSGRWYVGGWFSTADGGACKITDVPSATAMTCDTTATGGTAFRAASYTNVTWNNGSQWNIPLPAPGDGVGLEYNVLISQGTSGNTPTYYLRLVQGSLILIDEHLRISGSAAAKATALGFSGGVQSPGSSPWNIKAR